MSLWNILYVVMSRNRALVVLLCDALARGLIQPLCGEHSIEQGPPGDKAKTRPEKGIEKATNVHGVILEPAAWQDVYKALEVCLFVCRSRMRANISCYNILKYDLQLPTMYITLH